MMLYETNTGLTSTNYQVLNLLKGDDENIFKGFKKDPFVDPYPIVVKRISTSELSDYQKRIEREIKGMNKNRTISNVIKFEGLIPVNASSPFQFIAYEDYECTFKDLDLSQINVNICDLLKDAVTGLYHIHENKMTHRDIHPENILICSLDGKRVAKISNLALSKEFKTGMKIQSVSSGLFKQNGFVAPELFAAMTLAPDGVDTAVDIFSMGVVFFYMITGELLFQRFGSEMQENIANKDFIHNFDALAESSYIEYFQVDLFKQLILRMVSWNPSDRPTASDILNYPTFWNYDRISNFMKAVSNLVYDNNTMMTKLGENGGDQMFKDWYSPDDPVMVEFLKKGKSKAKPFKGKETAKVLRFARNLLEHCGDRKTQDIRKLLNGYENCVPYILEKFPRLLFHVYMQGQNFKNEDTLKVYYCNDYNFF